MPVARRDERYVPALASGFVEHVDGIRAVAALYVACSHAFLLTLDSQRAVLPGLLLKLTDWLGDGELGVAAFIVVSGYCLMLPVLRTPDWTFSGGFKRFIARRARRIVPPYYAALVISIALYVFSEHVVGRHVALQKFVPHILAHLALVHNLFSAGGAHYFNAALWSVALEWQIYFMFGLALLPLARRIGVFATMLLATGLGIVPRFFLHGVLDWTAPWFVGLFVAGMGAAAVAHSPRLRFRELATRIPFGTAVAGAGAVTLGILLFQTTENREALKVFEDLAAGIAVALGLAAVGVGLAASSRTAVRVAALLSAKPLVFVGAFSYSLYLVHWPLVVAAVALMQRAGVAAPLQFALALGVVIPATVVFAYGFYLVAERPFVSTFRRAATQRELGATAMVPPHA